MYCKINMFIYRFYGVYKTWEAEVYKDIIMWDISPTNVVEAAGKVTFKRLLKIY